jgi:cobalt/nickel transport system permease protein
VALGTSGHLLGGALAATLVGPYTGALCVTVVLLVQGLFFADGGLTALGLNVILIALVPAAVGYSIVMLLRKVLPSRPASVVPAAFVGALVSVPVAALVFTALYAVGGTSGLPIGGVLAAMVGVHTFVGIGEAIITALVVGSVIAARPDLVYAARRYSQDLEVRSSTVRAS